LNYQDTQKKYQVILSLKFEVFGQKFDLYFLLGT